MSTLNDWTPEPTTCRRHATRCEHCWRPADQVQTRSIGRGEHYEGEICTDEDACNTAADALGEALTNGTYTDPPCTCTPIQSHATEEPW